MAARKAAAAEEVVARPETGTALGRGSAFQGVEGQAGAVRILQAALGHDRVSHAYLFVGPHGVGRELVARRLAAALLCTGRTPGMAPHEVCGGCGACARVDRGLHPDVHVCIPEAEAVRRGTLAWDEDRKPSQDIKVEQVRQLRDDLRMTAFEGGWRVAILPLAERLRVEAANALLKTLEEPLPRSLLVLCAPDRGAVLETLRSRCQRVAFSPLPEELLARLLVARRALPFEQALAVAREAEGSMGRALLGEAAEAGETWEAAGAWLADLERATPSELLSRAEALEKDRDALDRLVRALARLALRRAEEAVPAARTDGAVALRARLLAEVAAGALELRGELTRPGANARLNLERFMLRARAQLQGFTNSSMNS
ncbi:MAG: DNA polymerase III subunit delta' [Deltaproteobacteria bacterium]|nr:DNA polymerase III subunit delta' [Deltaproteobacteria bacterium]